MKKSRSNHDSSRPPSRPSQRNTTSRRDPARRDPNSRPKQNYDSSYDRQGSSAGSNGSRYRDSYNDRYNDRYSDRNYDGYGDTYRRDPYSQEPPRRRSSSSSSRSRKSSSRRRRFPVSTVILLLVVVVLLVVLMKSCISDGLGSNYKMSLDPQSILVGETSQATVTGTVEGDKIQFTCSDTSIASVDNTTGKIEGKKLGTTTIAVLVNGKSVGSSTLSVVKDSTGDSPVTMNMNTLSLVVGDPAFTISVNVQSDEPPLVKWSSNNETVASVSGNSTQGTITARSSGEAIITATVGTKFASCTVTVKNPDDTADPGGSPVTDPNTDPAADPNATPNGADGNTNTPDTGTGDGASTPSVGGDANAATPTGIKLSDSAYSLKVGGTLQLKATITPDEAATLDVAWTTSDKSIATVSNGVVLARAPGNVEITAKVGELEAVCKIQVKDE